MAAAEQWILQRFVITHLKISFYVPSGIVEEIGKFGRACTDRSVHVYLVSKSAS